jgi:hypothetical protein
MGLDADAEANLMQALELSRRQSALAWELRCATDLAAVWSAAGQSKRARDLLEPIFDRFSEGLETVDLAAADRLLTSLR